jgi:hypothetical protein
MPAAFGERPSVKLVLAFMMVLAASSLAAAETVPLPRPRPAVAKPAPPAHALPDIELTPCRLHLTSLAIASSQPPIAGPGECGGPDIVRLEAILLPDQSKVALTPPALMRCSMAEEIATWVRQDVAAAVQNLGARLASIDNYASYDCRGRNNIPGAKLSEHGKANALDIRSVKLADGKSIKLADPHAPREVREAVRRSACARFSTVLGPGSDGYHEDHVHVDLQERRPGRFRMCQWDVRDPEPVSETAARKVPLPPERPKIEPASAQSRPKL